MSHSHSELVARSKALRRVRTLSGHTATVHDLTFSPDSRWLASGCDDKSVRLWEVASGRCLRVLTPADEAVYGVAFSRDGRWLASGAADHKVQIWEAATGERIGILTGATDFVFSVAFSPDGRWIAGAIRDRTVRVWERQTGQLVHTLTGHSSNVIGVRYSPCGRYLASASWDASLRIWEAATGADLRVFKEEGQSGFVNSLDFSPDSQWIATGANGGEIRLWRVNGEGKPRVLRATTDGVEAVCWSPDGSILVALTKEGENSLRLWHVESGQVVCVLPAANTCGTYHGPLAISPDGRWLATSSLDGPETLELWDLSALEVGPPTSAAAPARRVEARARAQVQAQLRTLPLAHVEAEVPGDRLAGWLRGAAAVARGLPLGLAHDLGLLLSTPPAALRLRRPEYLPHDLDTQPYLSFLHRLAAHPLVRELPTWQPPLADPALAVVLARLVEGLEGLEPYRLPAGPAGILLTRLLADALDNPNPAGRWKETAPQDRPDWNRLLPPGALARMEANLRGLDRQELRFLARYGPGLAGTPDASTLAEMLSLTGLPEVARLALTQSLNLLPRLQTGRQTGGVQHYPEGGYEGLARTGSLDSLLPSEVAYPRALFLYRVLNGEALYYGRERPPERRRELAFVVAQVGMGLGGDGDVLARALLLALGHTLAARGHEVLYSFAGAELSEPRPLARPGEAARVLYHRETAPVAPATVLRGVLTRLHGWRGSYRSRRVFWVLGEHFDADDAQEHAAQYGALRVEAPQHAWFVRVGPARSAQRMPRPPAAAYFGAVEVMETGLMWEQVSPATPGVEPEEPEVVVAVREPEPLPVEVTWKGKEFRRGDRVFLRSRAGTFKPVDTGHRVEIEAGPGQHGTVLRAERRGPGAPLINDEPLQVLRIQWDHQQWQEYRSSHHVTLSPFEAIVHADYLEFEIEDRQSRERRANA